MSKKKRSTGTDSVVKEIVEPGAKAKAPAEEGSCNVEGGCQGDGACGVQALSGPWEVVDGDAPCDGNKSHVDGDACFDEDTCVEESACVDEDARAMETARELRSRREAALGPAPIDNQLHRELPLARVAYALIGSTMLAFLASRLFARMGNAQLEQMLSIATTLLFIVTFVVWFISRHQAKKLTQERNQAE